MSERWKKNSMKLNAGDVQVLWAKLLGLIIRKLSLSSSHSITSWANILAWISDTQIYAVFPTCQMTAIERQENRKWLAHWMTVSWAAIWYFINSAISEYSSHPDP